MVILFKKKSYRWLIFTVAVLAILGLAVLMAAKVELPGFSDNSISNKHSNTRAATSSHLEDKRIKISGVVRDELGRPVVGALVLPLPHGGHTVETDADGKFEIAGPSENRRIETLFVRDLHDNLAAAVELDDYNKPVNVSLIPGITLTGRITDPDGKPIAGAKISPSVYTEDWAVGFGYTVFPPADSNGVYEIKALPIGQDYSIDVWRVEGYGRNSVRLGMLDQPGRKELDDIILEPANLSISGIVLDEKDKPISGVYVQTSGRIQPFRKVRTDSDGRFKIDGVCKGRVRLDAQSSDEHSWGFDEGEGGDKNVEIFVSKGRESCMIPAQKPPASLIGKTLPDLKELGIHLPEKDIRGKRILVCFWKLMHDESRDCIRHLAARSEELAKKNIVIIAAQIWPRNEKQFRRWLAKNNVKFPVSILPDPWEQKPEQRATHRWGIQNRVPWLILTDAQHVVRAEGFALEVLDKRIQETDPEHQNK